MYLEEKCKMLIVEQFLLIICSAVLGLLYCLNLIDGSVAIEGLKCLILFSFVIILFSIIVLKIGVLHVYTVFILTVSLYNISYIILSLFVGNDILMSTNGFAIWVKYSERLVVEYLSAILCFFCFVNLSFLCAFFNRNNISNKWNYDKKMESNGLFLFYLFLLPSLYYYYYYLGQVFFAGGYTGKYGISTNGLNFIVRISDDLLRLGFFLILASKCNIHKLIFPCLVYLTIQFCVSFITGSRVYFVSQALFVLVYFSMRASVSKLGVFIVSVSLVLFSVFVRNLRSTVDYDVESATSLSENSVFDQVIESFVLPQGVSMHMVSLTAYLLERGDIDYSLRYLLYPFFVPGGYVDGHLTEDYYNLADRLSAEIIPVEFANGAGLGSSIIAEFYVYGGLISVVFFSIIYGMFIRFIDLFKYQSNNILFIFILILPGLFYVGRASPVYPFLSAFKVYALYLILIKSSVLDEFRMKLKI